MITALLTVVVSLFGAFQNIYFVVVIVPSCLAGSNGSLLNLKKQKPRHEDVRAGPEAKQEAWTTTPPLHSCVTLS